MNLLLDRLTYLGDRFTTAVSSLIDELVPGKETRAGQVAQPRSTPSAQSRVKTYSGETVADGGGYDYRVEVDATFVVVAAPPAGAKAIGRVVAAEGPYAPAWVSLAQRLFARPPRAASTAAPASAPAPAGEAGGGGGGSSIDGNLAAAKQLADTFNVPHSWDNKPDGDLGGADRKKAIVAGDTKALESVVCSEFTMLALQKAGIDLAQRYQDPAAALPVAWKDGKHLRFVDLYMVANNQGDALRVILGAQHGAGQRVDPGSDLATALGASEAQPFLYVADPGGATALHGDEAFGAGAVAQSLGGTAIAAADRRPGDVQQKLRTTKGKTIGAGHSTQVWSVRGKGVAHLGVAGSPTLVPSPDAEIPPGWYRVDDVYLELGPETDPATVAELSVEYVSVIEANVAKATGSADATRIAPTAAADGGYDADAAASALTSTGRLPTSKWAAWKPSAPAIQGVVGKRGVER